jgi:hypothetical protein
MLQYRLRKEAMLLLARFSQDASVGTRIS